MLDKLKKILFLITITLVFSGLSLSEASGQNRFSFGVSPFFKSGYKAFASPSLNYRIRTSEDIDWNLGFKYNRNDFDDTPSSEGFDNFVLTCGVSKYSGPRWYYGADFHYYYMDPNDDFINYVKAAGKQLDHEWIPALSIKTGYLLTQMNLSRKWQFPLVLEIAYTFGEDYSFLTAVPGAKDHFEIQGFSWKIRTEFRF